MAYPFGRGGEFGARGVGANEAHTQGQFAPHLTRSVILVLHSFCRVACQIPVSRPCATPKGLP